MECRGVAEPFYVKKEEVPRENDFGKGSTWAVPFAGGKSRRRNVGLRRCGVFRRSLILYRCHREEYTYSWDTPRLINVGLLVIRLKCAFLERCFKRNTRPVTPPGRGMVHARVYFTYAIFYSRCRTQFYLPEEIIMQPYRLSVVCAPRRVAN